MAGHNFLGSVKVPFPWRAGIFQYQLPLNADADFSFGVIMCSMCFGQKGDSRSLSGRVVVAPDKLLWAGTLNLMLGRVLVFSLPTDRAWRNARINAEVRVHVPTSVRSLTSAEEMVEEVWESSRLQDMDHKRELVWMERSKFHLNFVGDNAPEQSNIVVKIILTELRNGHTANCEATVSLADATRSGHGGERFILQFHNEHSACTGSVELTSSWKLPFARGVPQASCAWKRSYADAYETWDTVVGQTQDPVLASTSNAVSTKLVYHTWTTTGILSVILHREHIIPKLFKRGPALTRVERYSILCSAVQFGLFGMSFLFRADCVMVPTPVICLGSEGVWYEKFILRWELVFATMLGVVMSIPVPLLLATCFMKIPEHERITDAEKRAKICLWRFQQSLGWLIVLALNTSAILWLLRFSSEYDWAVCSKWIAAACMSLTHRLISAPLMRGAVIGTIVILSRYGPCCDTCLILQPSFLPEGKVEKPHGSVTKKSGQEDENDNHAEDMDVGGFD